MVSWKDDRKEGEDLLPSAGNPDPWLRYSYGGRETENALGIQELEREKLVESVDETTETVYLGLRWFICGVCEKMERG